MLYLEDYLELIEHLPQELRDRLTLIRENDLKVNNTCSQIDTSVKQFFASAKNSNQEQRQCDYEKILKEYEKTIGYADEKLQLTDQTHDIMIKLIERLDGELEKFKLELEADHAGITEELERRSLEQEAAESRLEGTIKNHLNGHASHNKHILGFKDRRRSEHKQHHRHHPYYYNNNHHQDNGYHVKAKLSQNQQQPQQVTNGTPSLQNIKQMPQPQFDNRQGIARFFNRVTPPGHRQSHSDTASPLPYGPANQSAPASMSDGYMLNGGGVEMNGSGGGHYSSNITSFGNNPGFKYNRTKNSTFNQQHSALSAALSSATIPPTQSSISNSNLMNSPSIQNNKISTNTSGKGGRDLIDPTSPLVRQDPLAAAASQAIAATQQLHQGRRTSSLKASFAAINGAGGFTPDSFNCKESRNALAPMAPDQQAYRFNQQHYGKLKSNGSSSPLYVSVTKSGRPTKRPKHHASHLYPDESPPSISSDNSVFENSESMSSADFVDAGGGTFGSASPSSFEFHNGSLAFSEQSDAGNGTFYHQPDQTKYCKCRQISYGEMVACDNEDCEIEWFHYGCVGISNPPKGKWFCPDCKQKMSSNQQHHNSSGQQTQTHKKRGRKEILGN